MILVFFRHMPTRNNLSNTFIGRLDLECDKSYIAEHTNEIEGIKREFSISKLYCSPLKRAIQSIELYFPNKDYIVDSRLIERDLGDWSNESKDLLRKKYPNAFFEDGRLDFNYTPNGGESFQLVINRVLKFIIEMYDTYYENEIIGVVTHNGVITAVKCILSNCFSTQNIGFQPYMKPYVVELNKKTMQKIYNIKM